MNDNETKAKEIATNEALYGDSDNNSKVDECKIAALEMAKYKDKQILIFFMLSAKVREAQRAYYAASKGETKQKLLIRSKVLEKLLDEEIKKRIDTATKEEIQEMQIEWGNFVLCRQIENIYL